MLIGQNNLRELRATHYFPSGATSSDICLSSSGTRDNRVCENDTIGTIRLINSSVVRVVEPHVTTVTITDDECESHWHGVLYKTFFVTLNAM